MSDLTHIPPPNPLPSRDNLDADPAFQAGLQNILQPMKDRGASEQEIELTTRRAKEFYASQTVSQTHPSESTTSPNQDTSTTNSASELDSPTDTTTTTTTEPPPYPSTFTALAALIASGAPLDATNLPGLKIIPDKINEETPTEAKLAGKEGMGKKPWEK